MKAILPMVLGLALSISAGASVYQPHNKFPHRSAATENECNESHNLQPDGDHDCDDTAGVPEPATLGLLALGLGGLLIRRRR